MSTYVHRPLPKGSIRLLRIKPDPDDGAPVECQLFDVPILESERPSLYEALSYVWGSRDKPIGVEWKAAVKAEARALNVAIIVYILWVHQKAYLMDLELPGWALGAVQAAVDRYQISLTSLSGERELETDYETASLLAKLSLIISLGTNPFEFDYQRGTTDLISPLLLAASTRRLAVVERILDCPDPMVGGVYELKLAVRARYEAAVAGLMATKKLSPWLGGGGRLWGSAAQIALSNVFHDRMNPFLGSLDPDLSSSPEGRILQAFMAMDNETREVLYAGIKSTRPLRAANLCFLIDKYPFDLNSQNSEGQTIFMAAVSTSSFEITKHLLGKAEASQHPCHARDFRGRTPLMMAAEHGDAEVVELLLASGESMPNSTDKDGLTALALAALGVSKDDSARRRLGFEQTFSILMKHEGVQLDLPDNDGRTVLMLVMRTGWADIANHLLQTDIVRARLNAQDSKGRTAPLHALLEGKQRASVMEKQIRRNPRTVPHNIRAVARAAACLLQNDRIDIDVADDDGNSAISLLRAWPPTPHGMEFGKLENDWNRNRLLKYLKQYSRKRRHHV